MISFLWLNHSPGANWTKLEVLHNVSGRKLGKAIGPVEFHRSHGVPWISTEFHGLPLNSIEIYGNPWNSMAFNGNPWNSVEVNVSEGPEGGPSHLGQEMMAFLVVSRLWVCRSPAAYCIVCIGSYGNPQNLINFY